MKEDKQNTHDELLALANPLIDFMIERGYHFFLVAGKDGVCMRHLKGDKDELHGIISGLMETNDRIRKMFKEILKEIKQ